MTEKPKGYFHPAVWCGVLMGAIAFVGATAQGLPLFGMVITGICAGLFWAMLYWRLLTLDERPRRRRKHVDL